MDDDFSKMQEKTFALRTAARAGDVALLSTLLAEEPRIHPNEVFPWAASAGQIKASEVLLDAGVDIHRKLAGHMAIQMPLMFAAEGGPAIVDLLLDRGANPSVVDDNHKTVAHELLKRYVGHASKFGEQAVAKALQKIMNAGVKPDRCTKQGESLLQLAIQGGAGHETLSLLKHMGARLDLRNPDGVEPLHMAARFCNLPAIDFLLAHRVKPDAEDANGMTALFYCEKAGAAELLLSRGANLEHKDVHGRTPLAKLLKDMKPNSPTDVIKVLLAAGARTDNPDFSGTTPDDVITSRRLKNVKSVLAALKAQRAIGNVLEHAAQRPR